MRKIPRGVCWVKFCLLASCLMLFAPVAKATAGIERLVVGSTMDIKATHIDDYYFGILRGILTTKGLIRLDERGEIVGDLATGWQSDDAIVWKFAIADGHAWHDGAPVTAADVKFTIDYLFAKFPVYQQHFKLIKEVTAPDERTVVIRLSEANPRILVNLLPLRLLPRHIFASVDDPKALQGERAAIGCGPYIFKDYDATSGILRFSANRSYKRGKPQVDEVVIRLFKNIDTMYMALKKGEIDLSYFYAAGTDPTNAAILAKEDHLTVHQLPNPGVPNALFFNCHKPPLDDPAMRQALSLAIDYQEILRLFASGHGTPANAGFVPRGSAGFVDTPPLEYQPQRAKEALAARGFRDLDGNGVLEKGGEDLALEIVVRGDIAENMRLAELLKKHLGKVGIRLAIKQVDSNLFRQISDQDRSHQILLSRATQWGMMMWAGFGSGYFDARNIGWSNFAEPRFQQTVDRMNRAIDPSVYLAAAGDLQQLYAADLPGIALYWNTLLQPCRKNLSGWKINPMYGFLWEETWFNLKKDK